MSRLGPLAAVVSRLRAVRRPVWLLLAVGVLVGGGVACDHTNTYPIDFFQEMHYERFYRSQEPNTLDSPSSAVPVAQSARNTLSYTWPGEPANPEPNYSLDQAKALNNPVASNADNLKAGEALFYRNCVQCHGAKGLGVDTPQDEIVPGVNQACSTTDSTHCPGPGESGNGAANAYMLSYFKASNSLPPLNLTSDAVKGLSDGEIYYYVTNGIVDMPPFGHLLTPEQRWALVLYVRHLQGQG